MNSLLAIIIAISGVNLCVVLKLAFDAGRIVQQQKEHERRLDIHDENFRSIKVFQS